jgi:hypothetical protein
MATLFGLYPFLLKLYADGGYQGPQFQGGLRRIMRQVDVEVVKRSDAAKGFTVLPRRWIVERTIAWLIPRPGDQNPSQADPAFLRLEPPTALARQVPINEIWYETLAAALGQ